MGPFWAIAAEDEGEWFEDEYVYQEEPGSGSYSMRDYLETDGYPRSYDSTWRGPVTEADLYRQNVWDPEISGIEEYGWHYDWNTEERRWQPDFGWHTGKYDYTSEDRAPERRQANRPKRFSGTVESIKTLPMQNRNRLRSKHAVARLKLEDGKAILVDFGDVRRNPESIVQRGEEVTIIGRVGTINGRHVLFAETVRNGGRTVQLHREEAPSARAARGEARSSQRSNALLSGVIEDATIIRLNNEAGETRRFVQIALESGDMALLDLGDENNLRELGITEGERIRVRGTRDQISGRNFIRATELTINGENVALPRRAGEASLRR